MILSHTNAIEKVLIAQSAAAQNAGHPNLRGGPREWFIRDFLQRPPMKIDIYKARKNPEPTLRRYILIPTGVDATKLPEEIRAELGDLEYDKTIDIHPGEKRIALDADEAIRNIQSVGYHVQGTQIQARVSVG